MIEGRLTEISEAESNERYFGPADGVYDEHFRWRQREHLCRVTRKYDGRRPGDAELESEVTEKHQTHQETLAP